jgi:YVTN family beta-propeller protein
MLKHRAPLVTMRITAASAAIAAAILMLAASPAWAANPGYTYAVTATIGIGGATESVAANPDTSTAYAANSDDNTVSVIDETTNTVTTTIGVGVDPTATAVDPDTNTVYVTNPGDSTVSVINGATNTVTDTIGVGNLPLAMAVDPDTDTVYVANTLDNTISVINGATNSVTATIAGVPDSFGVAVDPGTDTVYASNTAEETVTVISGATDTVTDTISGFFDPSGVAVDPATEKVYVANDGSSTVSVIDESTNTVTGTIHAGHAPFAVAVDTSSNTIYAANFNSHTVTVADGATNTAYATVSIGTFGDEESNAVAVDPTTHTAYVAYDDSVAVISRGTTSTTTVAGTPGPVPAGSTVTLTATVSPAPDAGTVSFTLNGSPVAGCAAQPVSPTTGTATCSVTAPTKAGSYPVTAAYSGGDGYDASSGSTTLTVIAGPAATVAISGGNHQSAVTRQAFATPLSVTVTDVYGNPVPGATVTFTIVPAIGGTANFGGSTQTVTATTNAAGVATAPTLYAGTIAGPVAITATTPGVSGTVGVTFREIVIRPEAAEADLAISISAPGTLPAGGSGTITITVLNKGPQAAVRVYTSLAVPPDLTITSTGGGVIRDGLVFFIAPSLAAGHKLTYTVAFTAGTPSARVLLVAGTGSATADPNERNNDADAILTIT